MQDLVSHLTTALRPLSGGHLLIVTGAGISSASGIPTFRGSDPGAIWKRDPMEMATARYFHQDPVEQWRWYLHRFATVESARPNPAHLAVAGLESWQTARGGDFLLVTQNIDTLHEQAGSKSMIKVHGTSDRLRCSRHGCDHGAPSGSLPRGDFDFAAFQQAPSFESLPRCPTCDSILRAHVLFFDEYYQEHADYQFAGAQQAADRADVVIFIGTSFSVGVTDLFLQAAYGRGVPAFSIDPEAAPSAARFDVTRLPAPAETLLPAVCEALNIPLPG